MAARCRALVAEVKRRRDGLRHAALKGVRRDNGASADPRTQAPSLLRP